MEFTFKGANCVVITTKKAQVVIDDNLAKLGQKSVSSKADVALYTSQMLKNDTKSEAFVIDGPGEYEISEVSVIGIPARAHMDEEGAHTATIYRLSAASTMVAVLGHVYPDLSDEQLEKLGMVDVLIIPVGGNGYTLDAVGAAKLIKKIEPKIVIPTHYNEKGISYEVPQNDLEVFTKELGITAEKVDKIKIKGGIVPDSMVVYELTRS